MDNKYSYDSSIIEPAYGVPSPINHRFDNGSKAIGIALFVIIGLYCLINRKFIKSKKQITMVVILLLLAIFLTFLAPFIIIKYL